MGLVGSCDRLPHLPTQRKIKNNAKGLLAKFQKGPVGALEHDEAANEGGLRWRRSGEVFATPILFQLAALGLSVPDIPIGFLRRVTQAHSRLRSTYFFDFTNDS